MRQLTAALQQTHGEIERLKKQQVETERFLAEKAHEHESRPRRPKTVTLSTFDGDADKLDDWLFKLELATATFSDDDKIQIAELHLNGAALSWLRQVYAVGERLHDWQRWRAALLQRFQGINTVDRARAQLDQLRQRGLLHEYTSTFQEVSLRIPTLEEGAKVFQYIKGLRAPLRREVQARAPTTYMEAARLADRFDQLHAPEFDDTMLRRAPMATTTSADMDVDAVDEVNAMRHEQYGRRERRPADVRTEQRRCYNCGIIGHLARNCRAPRHARPTGNNHGMPLHQRGNDSAQ